jgi:molybdate transport system permease protein
MDWLALRVTLELATSTSLILLMIGLPIAYWAATTRRWWRIIVEASIAVPILLPPTVIGFYLLDRDRARTARSGRSLKSSPATCFPSPSAGFCSGRSFTTCRFAIRPFTSAFSAVDRKLVEASWCLGVSRLGTFRRVVFPLSWAGILTGLVLTFAHTVGEFGVVLMLGGDRPGITRTLSISIFDNVQAMDYATAGHTSLALVVFAFVVLTITYSLQRRTLPVISAGLIANAEPGGTG